MSSRRCFCLLLASTLALAASGCKSAAEKKSEQIMPAVEAFVATVPTGDPKDFVRTAIGYADTLKRLEDKARDELHPPPQTPAAAKLAPAIQWMQAARAEHAALEAAFQREVSKVEYDAQADLASAISGGATKPADEIAAALARTTAKPIVLWHGAGQTRGFDEDHQNLPPARRAVDPGERFIVGYVQRVGGEGVTFVDEKVTAEQKIAHVAFYELPSKRRFGVFTVKGETARLPKPVPLPGTVIPGLQPPLVENLLHAP
ncbi:Hypothetical protein A7982_06087 [Minicystis rosea]|nr:Hypothetical protein A7982_06087 [Minicystis rosea]